VRRRTAAYDAAFTEHDLLLMPTMPIKATKPVSCGGRATTR
jgi:hypothetical protein